MKRKCDHLNKFKKVKKIVFNVVKTLVVWKLENVQIKSTISFEKGWDNISLNCHLTNLCIDSLYSPLSPWSMLSGFQNDIKTFQEQHWKGERASNDN